MRIIGVTGGVASGKSTVARKLEGLGAVVLDADRAAHEALRLPQVEAAARQRWGERIFGPDGRIDRAGLARVVFAAGPEGERERRYLEQLIHPEAFRLLQLQAQALGTTDAAVFVLDAPLLMEAGWDDWCEKTVFVDAPGAARLSRALERGGLRRILRPARPPRIRCSESASVPMRQ
jgi:dephospho-CoA kinase